MTEEAQDEDKIPTLDEALGEAYDRMQTAELAKPEKVEEPKEEKPEKTERVRAKDGKFTKTEPEIKEDGAKDATPVEAPEAEKQVAKPTQVSQAPATWSAQAKALYDLLPPEVKAEAHKQEKDFQRALAKLSTEKKQFEGLDAILAPRRNKLAAMYGSEARALEQLFALSDFAEKDPMGFVQYFAQQRGLNLASLVQPTGQQHGVAPDVAPLLQKIQQLESVVTGLKGQHDTAINSQVEESYNAFVSNPKNVYFEQVREDMIPLLESGAAKDWQDAYDRACWARPDVRELMLNQQRILEDQTRQKEAEEKAKIARRVASTNVATNGVNGSSPSTPKTMEETMGAVWERMHGAA